MSSYSRTRELLCAGEGGEGGRERKVIFFLREISQMYKCEVQSLNKENSFL